MGDHFLPPFDAECSHLGSDISANLGSEIIEVGASEFTHFHPRNSIMIGMAQPSAGAVP
jgi:hypothetical protein